MDIKKITFSTKDTFGPVVASLKAAMAAEGSWVGGPVNIGPGAVALDSISRLTAAKELGIEEVPVKYCGKPTFYRTSDHAEIVVVCNGVAYAGEGSDPTSNAWSKDMISMMTTLIMENRVLDPMVHPFWTKIKTSFDPSNFAGRQWDACTE